jgi:hypothetical protein
MKLGISVSLRHSDRIYRISCFFSEVLRPRAAPVWNVCIARPRYRLRNFDAFYIFTIKFLKSRPRNFQTSHSGAWQQLAPAELN